MNAKPTLRALCVQHGILSAFTLWQESGVDPLLVWDALGGSEITEQSASQLLGALNALQGTSYTLDDIAIRLAAVQRGA